MIITLLNKNLLLAILTILCFTFLSCQKDEPLQEPVEPTVTEKSKFLTDGYWYLTHLSDLPFTQECSQDDKTVYTEKGDIFYLHGSVKCYNLESDTLKSTYIIDPISAKYLARNIKVPALGSTPDQTIIDTTDIIKLNANELKLRFRNSQLTLQTYEKRR
jgi:hypothetical protein